MTLDQFIAMENYSNSWNEAVGMYSGNLYKYSKLYTLAASSDSKLFWQSFSNLCQFGLWEIAVGLR